MPRTATPIYANNYIIKFHINQVLEVPGGRDVSLTQRCDDLTRDTRARPDAEHGPCTAVLLRCPVSLSRAPGCRCPVLRAWPCVESVRQLVCGQHVEARVVTGVHRTRWCASRVACASQFSPHTQHSAPHSTQPITHPTLPSRTRPASALRPSRRPLAQPCRRARAHTRTLGQGSHSQPGPASATLSRTARRCPPGAEV